MKDTLTAKLLKLRMNTLREIGIELGIKLPNVIDRQGLVNLIYPLVAADVDPEGLIDIYLEAE